MPNFPIRYRVESEGDRGVIQQVLNDRCYSPQGFPLTPALQRYYEQHAAPLIIDAGANIGASAVFFAHLYPNAYILAIEPQADNFKLLEANAAQCQPRILPLQAAIGDKSGTAFVHDPGRSDWAFRVSDEPSTVSTAVFSMCDLFSIVDRVKHLRDLELYPTPFIFKCDIEGGEDKLFSKDTEWVKRFPLIILEPHDWMLPGTNCSRNFLRALTQNDRHFDFCLRDGGNIWAFNTDLLKGKD